MHGCYQGVALKPTFLLLLRKEVASGSREKEELEVLSTYLLSLGEEKRKDIGIRTIPDEKASVLHLKPTCMAERTKLIDASKRSHDPTSKSW